MASDEGFGLVRRPIRRLPASTDAADVQLASGLALLAGLEHSRRPAMRWYSFSPPAVLLGSAQRPHELDRSAVRKAGLPVHKRRSGGGAVLSESLLSLDLVLPPDDALFTSNLTLSYRWFGEAWAEALGALGLEARLVEIDEARADTQALDPLLRRVCFGGLSPYEVLVGGRKIVGLAQVRRRPGALYQAGLYLRWEPERTAALMAASETERARLLEQLRARVVGVADLLDAPPSMVAVAEAVEHALERWAGLLPHDDDWSLEERAVWRELRAQYGALEQ
jgi:lipoate-protein ligase A